MLVSRRTTTSRPSSSWLSVFAAASTRSPLPTPHERPIIGCNGISHNCHQRLFQIPLPRAHFGCPHQFVESKRRPARQSQRVVRHHALHRPAALPHACSRQHQQRAGEHQAQFRELFIMRSMPLMAVTCFIRQAITNTLMACRNGDAKC